MILSASNLGQWCETERRLESQKKQRKRPKTNKSNKGNKPQRRNKTGVNRRNYGTLKAEDTQRE